MKALKIIWLFCTIGLLSACTADDITESSGSNGKDDDATTAIAISLDNLLPVNMNSRATVDDCLSQINDLNIRVTTQSGGSNSEKYIYIYCTRNNISIDGQSYESSKAYYIDGKMNYIHLNDIAAKQVKKIEVIANNGSSLYKKDWNSVMEKGDNNLTEGYCMMYGETTSSGEENSHTGQGSLNCRKFTVKLKRTRAMITVRLKGSELYSGVSITPKKIRLHNVPVQCTLASTNVATAETRTDGEAYDINWGTITSGVTVGAHIENEISDTCLPLYLFENMQGENKNTSSEQKVIKYPAGCSTVADAKKNKTHSYVEIEAEYRYEVGGNLKNSGTIIYRFFLGKNDYNDFNVERNTYYKLTLNLKGFGGAYEDGKVKDGVLVVNDEDVSWRVDVDIRDWGFEKNEYDFDAHSELGTINVMGDGWQIVGAIDESGESVGSMSWIRFASPGTGTGWTEPTNVGYQIAQGGKIQYYIQPMIFTQNFNENTSVDTKRTITVTVKKGSTTQKITFTQWVPIKLSVNGKTVFMERFEEEPLQEWGCQNENLTDRVISTKLGKSVSYNLGTNIGASHQNGNTWYINDRKLNAPAHLYCYNKSDVPGGAAGAVATYYVLPDQETLQAMIEYSRNNREANVEPLMIGEDYWTSSVDEDTPTGTRFWNGRTQQFDNTTDRKLVKRTRAIYTTSANGTVDYK